LKPLLPRHYRVRYEPPDSRGEEALVFVSEGKRLVVRGRAFRNFLDLVVPLLDGRHTLEDIEDRTAEVFDPGDLERCLDLLVENGIVEDAELTALPAEVEARLGPEVSYLREVSPDPALALDLLSGARASVVGVGAIGAVAAAALAAANVGHLRCVDSTEVSQADPYLTQLFAADAVGRSRAHATRERIQAVTPTASVEVVEDELLTDDDVGDAVEGSDIVLGCVDPGLASLTYRLNRACLEQRIPWCAATVSAFQGIVGPMVIPYETACFVCYERRMAAARDDPAGVLADLRALEVSRTDLSPHRENLAFGAGIVGNLLALQAFQALTGLRPPATGAVLRVDFSSGTTSRHLVLRKPWCPACFPADEP
jgi:bacteriocin biosynthesis cyclodehydratase domain-containing protein